MDRKSIILQYWRAALETEGWYPPYMDALDGVDAGLANWRPEGASANTIWETVTHVTHFKERLWFRLQGQADQQISSNDDTFIVRGTSEQDWQDTIARLFHIHRELQRALENLDEGDLDKPLPTEPIGAQFWDLIVHDAYHTGQIIFIRKLKGAWPARRSFQ